MFRNTQKISKACANNGLMFMKGNLISKIRRDNPNKYKGVCWKPKHNRWEVSININKKWVYIGQFLKIKDAIEAYDNKAIKLFGEKAITNKKLIEAGIKNDIPKDKDVNIIKIINLKNEIWKSIENYENLYEVSNFGRIKLLSNLNFRDSRDKEIIIPQFIHPKGYVYVNLSKNGKRKYAKVHRIVAKAFIPNLNNLPEVNHKDLNKQNNNSNNLEWSSHADNMKHASLHGAWNKVNI